ncbi:MAG: TIGR00730 family Rossman fold protein [Verrucomicrobiae bacterium]|nr:TIGR00730 family Rossman fold protein [Verrucomicrobiae bacterium]
MKALCVYCGSSLGNNPAFVEAAETLGRLLAREKITLVYGAGNVGLMGTLADACLTAGGHVIGVIPKHLVEWEVAHLNLPKLHVVESMHERKKMMAELADGFLTLPGGLGTLEELFEIATWAQLGMHSKPIGLCNVSGYFDSLIGFLGHSVDCGLLRPVHRDMIMIDPDPEKLVTRFRSYQSPAPTRKTSQTDG